MRKIHRWLGVPAAIFLLLASFTGVWLECVHFFGAEEAERERIRDLASSVTAQSVGAEFGAAFDKARVAAASQAGEQPLDKMVWQLKGDAPTITFFFGPHGQQAGRRITVHARTGEILAVEDYAEDSLILRLHSGEAFGDGGMVLGMVWGVLLFTLTVTGIIIYFRMKPRTPRTGLRKVFWAFAIAFPFSFGDHARADSPFYTDDPNFSPGWEIKLGLTAEHNSGGDNLTEVLDWNYAVVSNLRLNLTTYTKQNWPQVGTDASGYGDTEFKVKWRFLDEDPMSWLPAIGLAPKVYFPTADEDRGLGDGVWRFQLPIQFGKTVGKWYHWGEAGYQWAFDDAATDVGYAGIGTLYNFNPHFALGTELFATVPLDHKKEWNLLTTLGAIYTFNANWSLKASISHSLRENQHGGPAPSGQCYLVWNF